MQVVGVGAVLSNERGEVLLVRTAQAGWEVPGGRVEAGEDLLDALARELREEASCTAEIDRIVGVYAYVERGLLFLIFRGTSTTRSPAPLPTEEKILEAAWFAPADALHNVTHERERQALADALSDPASAIYRAYPSPARRGATASSACATDATAPPSF